MDGDDKSATVQQLRSVLGDRPWQPSAAGSRNVCFDAPPLSEARLLVKHRIRRKKRCLWAICIFILLIVSFVLGIIVGSLKKSCSSHNSRRSSSFNRNETTATEGLIKEQISGEFIGIQVKATLSIDRSRITCMDASVMSVYDAATAWWYTPINAPPPTHAHNLAQCLHHCNDQPQCYRAVYDPANKECLMQWTNADDAWLCSSGLSVTRVSVKKVCQSELGCPAYQKRCLCGIGPVLNQTGITDSSIILSINHYSLHMINIAVKCQTKDFLQYVKQKCDNNSYSK